MKQPPKKPLLRSLREEAGLNAVGRAMQFENEHHKETHERVERYLSRPLRAYTDASVTDPDARLYRKAKGRPAQLAYMGHALTENRNGLVVDIKKTKFSTRPTLQLNDFQAKANKTKVGKFPNKLYSGWYKSALYAGAYPSINLKGRTQLRLYFLLDDNDDLGADILKLYSGNADLANRPQLIVTYYVP